MCVMRLNVSLGTSPIIHLSWVDFPCSMNILPPQGASAGRTLLEITSHRCHVDFLSKMALCYHGFLNLMVG